MSDGINALDIVDTYDYDVGPGTPAQDTGYDYDVGPGTIQEPIVGGNLETDYVVDQRGRVIDTGGNVIKEAPVVDTGGFSFDKMLNNLFKGVSGGAGKIGNFFQENPLTGIAGLLLMSQLLKSSGGGGQAAGYTGPGINMGLKATRQPIQQPEYRPYSGQAVMGRQFFSPVTYAATGGQMKSGRYLDGPTDGMADKIPSSIDGKQPARLSHGEFVIPADVVSHLGNGNSDAGAKVLYNMMAKVRKARTGSTEQGKRINPEKFTPGGIAAYANGGVVKMAEGGPPPGASTSQNLSAWAGPYVTDYLSKAQALSQMPYQPFQGPLSAGVSPLQQQAFQGLASLDMPWQYGAGSGMAYQAGTGSFTRPGTSQAFMSPYMQDVVDVEKREAQRQADIARTQRGAQAVKAGAFGGSRQAILDAEAQRNLAQQMGDIQTKGMQSAYDRAVQQYNAERDAQLRAAMGLGTLGQQQFGTQLQGLQGILSAGGAQRDIEQQGIKALMDEYNKQMMWPYQQLQFQQSMLQGLPVATATTTPAEMSGIGKLTSLIGAGGSGYDLLKKIGLL